MTADEYKKAVGKKLQDEVTPSSLPNGIYRIVVQWFTENDPDGLTFHYQYENYLRLNTENF